MSSPNKKLAEHPKGYPTPKASNDEGFEDNNVSKVIQKAFKTIDAAENALKKVEGQHLSHEERRQLDSLIKERDIKINNAKQKRDNVIARAVEYRDEKIAHAKGERDDRLADKRALKRLRAQGYDDPDTLSHEFRGANEEEGFEEKLNNAGEEFEETQRQAEAEFRENEEKAQKEFEKAKSDAWKEFTSHPVVKKALSQED